MKDLLEKNVAPAQKRDAVRSLVEVHARPLRRSCECVGLSRSTWYALPLDWTARDAEVIAALEFLGEVFTQWAKAHGMAIQYTQPGKPNQNAYIERFNRTCREEVLDQHLFTRLDDMREATWQFLIDYNEHDALGGLTPLNIATTTPEALPLKCPLDGGAYDCTGATSIYMSMKPY